MVSGLTATALVIADMVGVGVFTSLGFQVTDIKSGFALLLLWIVGGVVAICGAQGGAGFGKQLPGFGIDLKQAIKKRYPALVALHPYGEVLGRPENRITVEGTPLDKYGVPIARIEYQVGENEHRTFYDIIESNATFGWHTFDQSIARELAQQNDLLLVCGSYEGFDERVREALADDELCIGDYVLTNGALPAMVVIDAVARLLPGVLGDDESSHDESFSHGLLEYPQYTRPADFRGMKVPEVLLSGNHAEIEKWRREQAKLRTEKQRPDLLK